MQDILNKQQKQQSDDSQKSDIPDIGGKPPITPKKTSPEPEQNLKKELPEIPINKTEKPSKNPTPATPEAALEKKPLDASQDPPKDKKSKTPPDEDLSFSDFDNPAVKAIERRRAIIRIFIILIVIAGIGSLIFGGIYLVGGNGLNIPFLSNSNEEKIEDDNQAPETETKVTENEFTSETQDTDDDGMTDVWELKYQLDIEKNDASLDPDFDRLSNLNEFKYGTNPIDPDTDKDTYKDGDEVSSGFNPNGTGKLQTDVSKSDSILLQGNWIGSLNGAAYNSRVVDLIFSSNGAAEGDFNIYQNSDTSIIININPTGSITYDSKTRYFEATFAGRATTRYEREPVMANFDMTLRGNTNISQTEITGTWNITPDKNYPWFSTDLGNFKFTK